MEFMLKTMKDTTNSTKKNSLREETEKGKKITIMVWAKE